MARRRLPIGIQTFRKLRESNCYYVDKTPFALQLIDEGTHYFLSRPRRFGKSLFLDTLKELFEGQPGTVRGPGGSRRLGTGPCATRCSGWNSGGGNYAEPGYLQVKPGGAAGGAGGGRGD